MEAEVQKLTDAAIKRIDEALKTKEARDHAGLTAEAAASTAEQDRA